MIVHLNGEYVPAEAARLSPFDRGFLFADGVYEVARFFRGRPYRLAEHVERLQEGLHALRLDADAALYAEVSQRLLAENRLLESDAIVYAQVTRGAAPRTHAFPPPGTPPTVFAFARASDPSPPPEASAAILVPDERWGRCNIKSVMLLPNVLAAQKAKEENAVDAILVRDGLALEATKANVFIVSGGVVRTAPNGPWILPGVTRGAVIDAARRLGHAVEERAFTVPRMLAADEVFLASTSLWTHPLTRIDGKPIGTGQPGPVTAMLRDELLREFRGEGA
jgi:D-alanine transaminase